MKYWCRHRLTHGLDYGLRNGVTLVVVRVECCSRVVGYNLLPSIMREIVWRDRIA